jgi:hypothetical protein
MIGANAGNELSKRCITGDEPWENGCAFKGAGLGSSLNQRSFGLYRLIRLWMVVTSIRYFRQEQG